MRAFPTTRLVKDKLYARDNRKPFHRDHVFERLEGNSLVLGQVDLKDMRVLCQLLVSNQMPSKVKGHVAIGNAICKVLPKAGDLFSQLHCCALNVGVVIKDCGTSVNGHLQAGSKVWYILKCEFACRRAGSFPIINFWFGRALASIVGRRGFYYI